MWASLACHFWTCKVRLQSTTILSILEFYFKKLNIVKVRVLMNNKPKLLWVLLLRQNQTLAWRKRLNKTTVFFSTMTACCKKGVNYHIFCVTFSSISRANTDHARDKSRFTLRCIKCTFKQTKISSAFSQIWDILCLMT